MSNLNETDSCISDTQETYYEEEITNENSKEGIINNESLNYKESQDFQLIDSEGDESIIEKTKTTQNEKNNCQKSIKQSDLQIQDALEANDKIVMANDKKDEIIGNKELSKDKSVKKTEKDISSDTLDPMKRKELSKEDTQDISPEKASSLLSQGIISDIEIVEKSKIESSNKLSEISKTQDTEDTKFEDVKEKDAETQELVENEPIKKTGKDVMSSNLQESETKEELFDEDEIIQGTPPQSYSSTKSINNIEITNLKRKDDSSNELSAKVLKRSIEDVASSKKFDDEESHQSCESDDSYQDLFKNAEKNVIIEETQDLTNQEFTQSSLKSPLKDITDDDKTQEHCFEQTMEEKDNVFSTKCCNMEKDENLNLSTKLTDISANDSIISNINSINENNSRLEDNSLSIEIKEKSEILDETDKSIEMKDPDQKTVTEKIEKIEEVSRNEPIEKIAEKINEETSVVQTKASIEAQSSVKSLNRLRSSVELIYTGCASKSKTTPEIVEIDEDGEKIVLDSSAEMIYDCKNSTTKPEIVEIVDDSHEDGDRIVLDSLGEGLEVQTADKHESIGKNYREGKTASDFSYKSAESMKESSLDSKSAMDKKLMNGSSESKRSDATLSIESDTFSGCNIPMYSSKSDSNIAAFNTRKFTKGIFLGSKDLDNTDLISISDNEISNVEEKNKSDLTNSALVKAVQIEREIDMYVKFKCTLHMDENTKEFLSKELTTVQCETALTESTNLINKKNEDSQSSLADISDNKESSPGSVNSNPQLYHLNPSRLSIMSSISSSSSASSAASLAAKLNLKNHFSMPLGPAKHAKKHLQDVPSTMNDKQTLDEMYERLTREWKNHHLLITTILNCINAEVSNSTVCATSVPMDYVNVSNERLDDHHHSHHLLEKTSMRSSTPEVPLPSVELITTPKSTKKSKGIKRPRSKLMKSSIAQTNGNDSSKDISDMNISILQSAILACNTSTSPSRKKIKIESTPDNLPVNDKQMTDMPMNSPQQTTLVDDLIGRNVFAKWSDNNYYPGVVSDRVKIKYKVNFYDGKNKMLIPEFVIPIPKILKKGLSVYATTKTNDYGSCGIIVDIETKPNDENMYYIVETDEGERLRVQVQDIFLSADQAQVLKEELLSSEDKNSMPSTPKVLGQVTLDNMVEGKRRSKRIGTPIVSTPKSRINVGANSSASKVKMEPSVSGISNKKKERSALSENESVSSDSNVESIQMQDEYVLRGVQKEIIGTPFQQIVKGPPSRIKSKPRSKKKVDDAQTIATLGPIPSSNSNIFKGMSFILTCASLDTLDRYRYQNPKLLAISSTLSSAASSMETEVTETDETENEDDWTDRPFVRDRLHRQIIAGSGKIYENFNQIPKDEYKNTKLITNVPNTTAKSILCLSVGIPACNHKWIIRCCLEGKIVSAAEDALPTGWSLQKKTYVEVFQAAGNKPLSKIVVIIPILIYDKEFTTFWQQICENAGAVVLIAENSESMELMDFDSDVIVVSNQRCPSWAVDRAIQLRIPVLSTTWVVQCLIEGKRCPYEQHPRYKYNYTN